MTKRTHQDDEEIAELLSEYVDLLNEGTAPSVDGLLKRHPKQAERLRPLLETARHVAGLAKAIQPEGDSEAAFQKVRARALAKTEEEGLRRSVKSGTGVVPLDKRPDFLLLLLRAAGEVWGKTKLVKLLFLLGKETDANRTVPDFFKHVAYDFGPFDDAVYRDAEALEQAGLIEIRQPKSSSKTTRKVDAVYRLTPKGKKFADALARGAKAAHPSIIGEIGEIATKYGGLPLNELLQHVYRKYPEYTTKSKIRSEVLGDDDD